MLKAGTCPKIHGVISVPEIGMFFVSKAASGIVSQEDVKLDASTRPF